MIKKNVDKELRKSRRLPPIPYTRKGKTKKDVIHREMTKHKGRLELSF